jgi:RNA-dependent RNA polymerase
MDGFFPEVPHVLGVKTPSEKILTDGCGFMNGAALALITRRLCLRSRPTAVQGRVAGSKGLWILHPRDRSLTAPPRIWIRGSQKKIELALRKGSADVIFDLLEPSGRISVKCRLNYQLIMNLAENGVDTDVFKALLYKSLSNVFTSLTQWDGAHAMPLLWSTVNNLGNVTRTRLQKITHGMARAMGLATRFDIDRDGDDPENEDKDLDGNDKSLYQIVLELIQAGFNPKSSSYLYECMGYVVNEAMHQYLRKYHLEVPESAEAFIIPGAYNYLCIYRAPT